MAENLKAQTDPWLNFGQPLAELRQFSHPESSGRAQKMKLRFTICVGLSTEKQAKIGLKHSVAAAWHALCYQTERPT